MDSTLTEEEISCIKQKKPRIIFVIIKLNFNIKKYFFNIKIKNVNNNIKFECDINKSFI